jgi:phosphomannomutase / phosphoglucomutase
LSTIHHTSSALAQPALKAFGPFTEAEKNSLTQCFGPFDVRALVNDTFNELAFYAMGKSWAQVAKQAEPTLKQVWLVFDARLHSPLLAAALVAGLEEEGLEPLLLGQGATPFLYFSAFTGAEALALATHPKGGLMVTASHNAAPYNGIKCLLNNHALNAEQMESWKRTYLTLRNELKALPSALQNLQPLAPKTALGDAMQAAYLQSFVKEFGLLAKGLTLALDGFHGAGGPMAEALFTALGATLHCRRTVPNGAFPDHAPDPSVSRYLKPLGKLVRETGASLGFALDGDADRLAVVDELGEVLSNDKVLVLLAKGLNKERLALKGFQPVVVCEIKAPAAQLQAISNLGLQPVLSKTGHVFMKRTLAEHHAALGGEYSGHFFIKEGHAGYDDPFYVACRLLQLWQKGNKNIATAKPVSQLLEGLWPASFLSDEFRLPCESKGVAAGLVTVLLNAHNAGEINWPLPVTSSTTLDGLRLDMAGGFVLLRPSNTEPIVSLRFEAPDAEAYNLLGQALHKVLSPHLNVDELLSAL